jgi:hypothetical protein
MKHIELNKIWQHIYQNVRNHVGHKIDSTNKKNRCYDVYNHPKNIISTTVDQIIRINVRRCVANRVWYNHKLFKYNHIQQYKDNL